MPNPSTAEPALSDSEAVLELATQVAAKGKSKPERVLALFCQWACVLLKSSGRTNYWLVVAIGAAEGHALHGDPVTRETRELLEGLAEHDAEDQLAFVAAGLAAFTLNVLDGHQHSEDEIIWAAQDVLDAVEDVGADALAEGAALVPERL